jgi:RimJ/RimL family protein N-acetyltransferase
MPGLADVEHRAAFDAPDRSRQEGPRSRAEAWRIRSFEVAQRLNGVYGPISLDGREGRHVGEVGRHRPGHDPAREIGSFMVPEAEGRGPARKPARAALDRARRWLRFDHRVGFVDPGHVRSLARAFRLGGVRSARAGIDPANVVILCDLHAARGAA